MATKYISLSNLPDTIKNEIKTIQNANQVEQLSLFIDNQSTLSGFENSISNTFNAYDLWSRFIRNQRKLVKISEAPNRVVVSRSISDKLEGVTYEGKLEIAPALIVGKDEDYFAWPSDREEKVERALIRLASQGKIAKISGKMGDRYAVYFSIKEIANELKSVNQTLSFAEIKQALQILKGSELNFKYQVTNQAGEQHYSESKMNYLSSIHFSGQQGKSTVKCLAVLNEFMSQQIESIGYRGYYFNRAQSFKRTLSRWLTLRLYHMFRYASVGKTHHFLLKKTMIKFGSIDSEDIKKSRLTAIRRDMANTMKDLIDSDIIDSYEISNIKNDEGDIVDYKYELRPSDSFCAEILSLNKHNKKITEKAKVLDEQELQANFIES